MNMNKIIREIELKSRFEIKRKKYPLYLAATGKYGIGLYTDADISKDDTVAVLRGRVIPYDPDTQANEDETVIMVSMTQVLLADSPVLRFLNHSCKPNLKITGTRTLTSKRKIAKGDQLTIDYSTSENSKWIMECACRCGQSNCRGQITGIKLLDNKTYRLLEDTIPQRLRKSVD